MRRKYAGRPQGIVKKARRQPAARAESFSRFSISPEVLAGLTLFQSNDKSTHRPPETVDQVLGRLRKQLHEDLVKIEKEDEDFMSTDQQIEDFRKRTAENLEREHLSTEEHTRKFQEMHFMATQSFRERHGSGSTSCTASDSHGERSTRHMESARTEKHQRRTALMQQCASY